MLHISDEMIDAVVGAPDAQQVLLDAFRHYATGDAAMQQRIRTEAQGVKLSTLGAVIPGQDVVGAKVYTTLNGQFSFVILLFSALDGRPLATLDAGALTRIRTAACTVLVARKLARPASKKLGLFGAGVQGFEHAVQFAAAFDLDEILVHDPYAAPDLASRLRLATGVAVHIATPDELVANSDIVITASRSTIPLFEGSLLRPGTFVAAIGSSLPYTRELDDDALARAKAVVIEWREQSLAEAGDLVLAGPGVLSDDKIIELADVLTDTGTARDSDNDIFIYKAVGVGLQDIALAGHAYRLIAAQQGLASS